MFARMAAPGSASAGIASTSAKPCRYCYAESINRRLGTGVDFKPGHRNDIEIFLDEKMLLAPLRWKRPRMIFVCSMTDLFADFVNDEMIDRVFAIMALSPQHRFQVLTKRTGRMREYVTSRRRDTVYSDMAVIRGVEGNHDLRIDWPLPNVWLGVSAEDQERWDERKEDLRQTPAAIRFASFEPLLGPIVEPRMSDYIQWAITGGESGRHARPMHPQWERDVRDQCASTNVLYFKKQWGEWAPKPDWYENHHRSLPMLIWDGNRWSDDGNLEGEWMVRVGKKRAGRFLDGVEWNGMPA